MSVNSISFLAFFTYFVASALPCLKLSSKLTFSKSKFIVLGSIAVGLHGYVLYRWIDTPLGQNLSISHLFSLTCWLISITLLLAILIKPFETLSVFILPISALSILLAIFFPGDNLFQTRAYPSTLIHILFSILAFGILGMAALQASILYLQNRILRNKSAYSLVRILPPLQTMETFLFQIIWSGFLLLSASLSSALLLLNETLLTHHLQKIILSVLAWILFATLLYGHHQSGLRGLKAIRWTLIGVGLLMGAYLAGKWIPIGF